MSMSEVLLSMTTVLVARAIMEETTLIEKRTDKEVTTDNE